MLNYVDCNQKNREVGKRIVIYQKKELGNVCQIPSGGGVEGYAGLG